MNLRWKGGQPKSPKSSAPKTLFLSQSSFLLLEFIIIIFLKFYLITLILESLVKSVTPILEWAGMYVSTQFIFLQFVLYCLC